MKTKCWAYLAESGHDVTDEVTFGLAFVCRNNLNESSSVTVFECLVLQIFLIQAFVLMGNQDSGLIIVTLSSLTHKGHIIL